MKTKQEMMDEFNESEKNKQEIEDKKQRFYSKEMIPFKNEYLKYLNEMTNGFSEQYMIEGVTLMFQGKLTKVKCFDDWYNSLS